jgi:hypothetical protein
LKKKSDQSRLTVLIFKDNLIPRTFKVSQRWFSQIGLLFGFFIFIALLSTLIAIRFYQENQRINPHSVVLVEQQLNDLQTSYQFLQERYNQRSRKGDTPQEDADATEISLFYRAFPEDILIFPPEMISPIAIDNFRTQWKEGQLEARFHVAYSRNDGGNQQGRLLVLARGPQTLLSYPSGTMNPPNSRSLFNPEHGEYFSVSRFRQSFADFGPLKDVSTITHIEIFIFSLENELIAHKVIELKGSE